MKSQHPAAQFVRTYHEALSDWFAGRKSEKAAWRTLASLTNPEMTLVYPSGRRLGGDDFLESIRDLHGTSEGFVAIIDELEVVHEGPKHAVVSYVEIQSGAKNSAGDNRRSALALLVRDATGWKWKFIQETALG